MTTNSPRPDDIDAKVAAVRNLVESRMSTTGPAPADPKLAAVADALESIAAELRNLREP